MPASFAPTMFIALSSTNSAPEAQDLKTKLAASVAPAPAIFLNAQFEADLTELDEDDAREMLADAGLEESGLDQLARVGYDTLGLSTFLTAGEKEVRAWQIHKGYTAPHTRWLAFNIEF